MEEIVEKVSAAPLCNGDGFVERFIFKIPLTPRAQRYAAFVTPFGTYIPKKMMFGPEQSREMDFFREGVSCDIFDGRKFPSSDSQRFMVSSAGHGPHPSIVPECFYDQPAVE
ncbi:hypothetical protein TNCV_2196071 [Trichonephila clavipes]|nr:hypothetical protein TNCV_2196071 [Trichonephila clavipes]